jgi:hypothetical protein
MDKDDLRWMISLMVQGLILGMVSGLVMKICY